MQWISVCFVLHNISVDVEGSTFLDSYIQELGYEAQSETAEIGEEDTRDELMHKEGSTRRKQLVEDYFQYNQSRNN